jgi:hypothetical protein
VSTAYLIRTLARTTHLCQTHGDIVQVDVNHDGRVIDRGSYMVVTHYTVRWEDGAEKTYWIRGAAPMEVKP